MKRHVSLSLAACVLPLYLAGVFGESVVADLVVNGSFEQDANGDGVPDGWVTAGAQDVKQTLSTDTGRGGRRCAKLVCTVMGAESPAAHAMICQLDTVGVQRGRWYRLTFWARGEGIKKGFASVALNSTRTWRNAGLAEAFGVHPQWTRFEFLFRARQDLPAEISRLQFWYTSTGTLWLDDVDLVETATAPQWYPEIATDGVKNWVPNSSFECGAAGWGGLSGKPGGWSEHLYRLEGSVDAGGTHASHCMKIELGPNTSPIFSFDYFDAVHRRVRQVLIANRGWFRVRPNEALTLSAFLRADVDGVVARMAAVQCGGPVLQRSVSVGRHWQRHAFTFSPTQPFCFIAVGLDLNGSKRDSATLWVDAVQLERGRHATEYAPRLPLESFVDTGVAGSIFTDVKSGLHLTVRAFSATDEARAVKGSLVVKDYLNRLVFQKELSLSVPAKSAASLPVDDVCVGRRGFFRATWRTETGSDELRCAVIEPHTAADSPIGMNHAYPWDFLLPLAHQAGISWWRDWSAKWHTVEPKRGHFDFAIVDPPVERVVNAGGHVLLLLPFPSSTWSTTYRADQDAHPPQDAYLRRRLPLSYAPQNLNEFGAYAAAAVRHYRGRVGAVHVLNEPLYTDYALPMRRGHKLEDYIRLLEVAHRAIKAVDPNCLIVGGIGAYPGAGMTRRFVQRGGLCLVDVLDVHLYSPAICTEAHEADFASLEKLMHQHGGPKPIWITEYGCYADDDPACIPQVVGDATMNRCKWPSERAAAEHIVKFAAVTFAHGVRKIFFHAGVCGPINSGDASGVFFEYGGAPRVMYAAVAALTQRLGTPDGCLGIVNANDTRAFVFRTLSGATTVAWRSVAGGRKIILPPGVSAFDLMGNHIPGRDVLLAESPVYLTHTPDDAQAVERSLVRP